MENSWNSVGNASGKDKTEVKYIRFNEGATKIRVLDEAPFSRWTHWLKAPANGGKGVGIDCIGKDCPCCAINKAEVTRGVDKKAVSYPAKMLHSINVLIKRPDLVEVNVLEQGNGLFGQLKDCMTMLGSAGLTPDLRTVDLLVNRTGKGFSDTKYTVMPLLNSILSITDKEITEAEKYVLTELKPKLDKEQITKVMNGATFDEIVKKDEAPVVNIAPVTNGFDNFEVDFTEVV